MPPLLILELEVSHAVTTLYLSDWAVLLLLGKESRKWPLGFDLLLKIFPKT